MKNEDSEKWIFKGVNLLEGWIANSKNLRDWIEEPHESLKKLEKLCKDLKFGLEKRSKNCILPICHILYNCIIIYNILDNFATNNFECAHYNFSLFYEKVCNLPHILKLDEWMLIGGRKLL